MSIKQNNKQQQGETRKVLFVSDFKGRNNQN